MSHDHLAADYVESILPQPSGLLASNGETFSLLCRVQKDNEALDIVWTKDGNAVTIGMFKKIELLNDWSLFIYNAFPKSFLAGIQSDRSGGALTSMLEDSLVLPALYRCTAVMFGLELASVPVYVSGTVNVFRYSQVKK